MIFEVEADNRIEASKKANEIIKMAGLANSE